MKTIELQKGDIIFRQGDLGECMYDIRAGRVGVYVNYGEADEQKLTELQEGAFFGEMSLADGSTRSATVAALEDGTTLREIGERDFVQFFAQDPERVMAILRNLSGRLRGLTVDYLKACQTLKELSDADGEALSEEIRERVERYGRIAAEKN